MRDHLVLFVNGVRQVIRGRDAFLSLSDYLRRRLGLTGTKIVCSEGDCGACTVLIGRDRSQQSVATARHSEVRPGIYEDPSEDLGVTSRQRLPNSSAACHILYRPVDSCIQFLFQLDGAHIVTVEGLRPEGGLTPVQQAMVDCHGSQCGFCTPGFVMALTGLVEQNDGLDRSQLCDGLTGNLCRCTGYTPIIEAGVKSCGIEHERLNELYPPCTMLAEFDELRTTPITLRAEWHGEAHVAACPTTLADALDFLGERPGATIVAGATDVGVRLNKDQKVPLAVLDLNRIDELDYVRIENRELIAGARATWTVLLDACRAAAPEFARVVSVFGAPQIRHVGTIAGNIANASPIADSLPFLYVMDATLVLASAAGRREVNVNNFYRGYKQLDLRPGELIVEVRIPLPDRDELLRLYKVSRRRDLDISSFTAALRMRLRDDGTIAAARIALGGIGPTVLRPDRTEQYLRGQQLSEEVMRTAGNVAADEITPINDVRGSVDYRRQLTRNVFLKFYFQAHPEQLTA
jgi:xanthine dehydrogenase small subunit